MTKTVLVYRALLLGHSETFIKEQILALRTWRPVLVGRRRIGQLPLEDLDVCTLEPDTPGLFARIHSKVRRELGWPPHLDALKRKAPLLLHAHFGLDALEAAPIASALKIPMLVTLHGYDINIDREWWEAGNGGLFMRRYPHRLLKLAQRRSVHFVAVSQAIRRRAIEYGIPAEKITVCYIGIDPRKFAPGGKPVAERPPRVLFVGRLVEKKGCRHLIEAMPAVQKALPNARLVIIGDGPLRSDLERQAQRLGVDAEFRGAQPRPEIKRELDLARVFCLPSVTAANGDAEGFGMVLLEAQAAGVPVVTSARGGAAEGIIDGVTGFAFEEGDVAALAGHLRTTLSDDEVASGMAAAGPPCVAERFEIRRCTEVLEATMGKCGCKRICAAAAG